MPFDFQIHARADRRERIAAVRSLARDGYTTRASCKAYAAELRAWPAEQAQRVADANAAYDAQLAELQARCDAAYRAAELAGWTQDAVTTQLPECSEGVRGRAYRTREAADLAGFGCEAYACGDHWHVRIPR